MLAIRCICSMTRGMKADAPSCSTDRIKALAASSSRWGWRRSRIPDMASCGPCVSPRSAIPAPRMRYTRDISAALDLRRILNALQEG